MEPSWRRRTGINQPPELLQRVRARALKSDASTLYRNGAAQLLVEEVFVVAVAVQLGADGVDDALGRLSVVQLARDEFPLLGVWLSVRRRSVRIVRPLHACEYALTAGAGREQDAGHMLRVGAVSG